MKVLRIFGTLALLSAGAIANLAAAQSPARVPAPVAAPPASAPPVLNKTKPRAMTPAEQRDSATVPGDLRPEEPVVPQFSVPLGKAPAANAPAQAQRHDKAAAMGGVDDSVARCKAAATPAAREACLDRLGRPRKAP